MLDTLLTLKSRSSEEEEEDTSEGKELEEEEKKEVSPGKHLPTMYEQQTDASRLFPLVFTHNVVSAFLFNHFFPNLPDWPRPTSPSVKHADNAQGPWNAQSWFALLEFTHTFPKTESIFCFQDLWMPV